MSDRVVPTEPGFWWYRWKKIGPVIGYVDWFGQLCLYDGKNQTPVSDCEFEWLEPVAPLGTAARLAAAEAELAELKQRIAAAPVGWSLTADGDDEPWLVSMVHPVCETERRRTGGELRQVRLLEVRDGE